MSSARRIKVSEASGVRNALWAEIVTLSNVVSTCPAGNGSSWNTSNPAWASLPARNAAMFAAPGTLYVYRSYGIHWCVNVACEPEGTGAAVLLRAVEPTHGIEEMRRRRRGVPDALLCAGPGRLAQALAITAEGDGQPIFEPPFALLPPDGPVEVVATPRVGITKAVALRWRYVVTGSSWASRGPRRAPP